MALRHSWPGPRGNALASSQSWLTRLRETIARATRLMTSTKPGSTSAPAQAMDCHDVYGLPANWYMTTGTLAIGPVTSLLQYWLPNAVNSSGAVSPEIRASASRMPVTMPGIAERYITCTVTFHCGTPSDSAASRICEGTSRSISSVVRNTTGSTMKASAIAPATAEKLPPACITTSV